MTKVFYSEYYDNIIINIEGHSGFGVSGGDIVCAGVSALAYTLLNTLLDEEVSGNIKLIKNYVSDGVINLEIKTFDYSKKRIDGMISLIMTGFYMLEESYPDYIRIE